MSTSPDARHIDASRLAVAADAQPAWRVWGDQLVIHHALSNDTHRLAQPAGMLLQLLVREGPQSPQSLARLSELSADEFASAMDALIDLDLVVWC